MALPPLDADLRLPPGRHAASLAEVESLFVVAAPNQPRRRHLWTAMQLHMREMLDTFGPAVVWIDGGFVTHKKEAPEDVDLVYVVPGAELDRAFQRDSRKVLELLTLKDLIIGDPGPLGLQRLQPVGGLVDAFVVAAELPQGLAYWDWAWSLVKASDGSIVPGAQKGYLEVSLS
jgi:hypothetical protein